MKPKLAALTFVACVLIGKAYAAPDTLDLAKLADPQCDTPFAFRKPSGNCSLPENVSPSSLKLEQCQNVPGLKVVNGKCEVVPGEVRGPMCRSGLSGLVYDTQDKVCKAVVNSNVSARGDYEGDCFRIVAEPPDSGLKSKEVYAVTHQEVDGSDKRLYLVQGDLSYWPSPWSWGCRARLGPVKIVNASVLERHAARREGWAYGALTMPYKYFPHDKSFVAGLPIGGFLGWRWGALASGSTLAVALTLSQVKADTLDPKTLDGDGKPTKTGTADVAALSLAIGYVFDVSKSSAARPYKAGVFVGVDRTNQSPTVNYANNGKTWVAIQFGFDFTDN